MTARKETLIRINVRPAWQQRTLLSLDAPELFERMEAQARLAAHDFEGAPFVEVFAQSGIYGIAVRIDRPLVLIRTAVGRSFPAWLRAE